MLYGEFSLVFHSLRLRVRLDFHSRIDTFYFGHWGYEIVHQKSFRGWSFFIGTSMTYCKSEKVNTADFIRTRHGQMDEGRSIFWGNRSLTEPIFGTNTFGNDRLEKWLPPDKTSQKLHISRQNDTFSAWLLTSYMSRAWFIWVAKPHPLLLKQGRPWNWLALVMFWISHCLTIV